MFGRKLACSFCRRSEDRVSKLVAGPRVYICDRCAIEVIRIMNDADPRASSASQRESSTGVLPKHRGWWRRWVTGSSERQSVAHPMTSGV